MYAWQVIINGGRNFKAMTRRVFLSFLPGAFTLFMSEEEARGQWQDSVLIAEESQASQLRGRRGKRSKCQLLRKSYNDHGS